MTKSTAGYLQLPTPCFYMPPMHCSFPVRRHPLFHKLKPEADAWALVMAGAITPEDIKAVLCEKLVLLPCLMFPTAKDSAIPTIIRFIYWFTLFDTCLDNSDQLGLDHKATSKLVKRYLQLIQSLKDEKPIPWDESAAEDKAGRFLSSFASTLQSFHQDMTPLQFDQFTESIKKVLLASAGQNKLREDGILPTAEEFLEERRILSGLDVAEKLLEYALGIDLGEEAKKIPEVEEIMRVANEYVCCVNDMISFRAEYVREDFYNLPSTICVSEKVSIQEAVVETCNLIKVRDERFAELHERISSAEYCTDELRCFLDGLGYFMSGNWEWSWQTGRYHGSEWIAPPPLERQGIMKLGDPVCDMFTPCMI